MQSKQRSPKQYLFGSLVGTLIALVAGLSLISVHHQNPMFVVGGCVVAALALMMLGLVIRRFVTLRAEARHRAMFG